MTGIKDWTDKDYAEAALDMLPGSVEEIVELFRTHNLKNNYGASDCPLAQWVKKWTGGNDWATCLYVYSGSRKYEFKLAHHSAINQFVIGFDNRQIIL